MSQAGNDLVLNYSAQDAVTVADWFAGQRIETVAFADGAIFDAEQVEAALGGVLVSNRPPVLAVPVADQVTDEDAAFNFQLPADTFTDPDVGDALSFSATLVDGSELPAWLLFDAATQTFSGTPTNDDVGTLNVRVTAADNDGESAVDDFVLTVQNVNDAPVLAAPIPDQSATEGTPFTLRLAPDTFADDDAIHGDRLSLAARLAGGAALPDWLSFDAASATFTGTAPVDSVLTGTDGDDTLIDSDAGVAASLAIAVTATDAAGAGVSAPFTLALQGVPGNDLLNGGAGDDTYLYNLGDGLDTIEDASGTDTVVFGAGFAFANTVIRQGQDANGHPIATLRFLDAAGNESTTAGLNIRLNADGTNPIDAFRFADGTAFTAADLLIQPLTHHGTRKRDTIITGRHDDTVLAERGEDYLDGGAGNDTLFGGRGEDTLLGGTGNDTLDGGQGENTLIGGAGNDTLLMGAGENTVHFGRGDGWDTVRLSEEFKPKPEPTPVSLPFLGDFAHMFGNKKRAHFLAQRQQQHGPERDDPSEHDPTRANDDNDVQFGEDIGYDQLAFARHGAHLDVRLLGTPPTASPWRTGTPPAVP